MDKETIIKFYELKRKAQPKRILGLNNSNKTEKDLQDLQEVVVQLIEIIENIFDERG